MSNEIALLRSLGDIVAEYDEKVERIPQTIATMEQAHRDLMMACTIQGEYGRERIDDTVPSPHTLKRNLLKSGWWHIYKGLNIATIASAKDRKLFEQGMEDPAPLTLENIRATFGDYLLNPRENILRGLAEVFCDLDPAFKSHDRMKIGVKGLPKRVILSSVSSYAYGWGFDKLKDIVKALDALAGRPQIGHNELADMLKDGDCQREERGIWLKRFKNGNAHLFFSPDVLLLVNRGLGEYYGEVLADCVEKGEKAACRAVSKDLQYYPTPQRVVDEVMDRLYIREGELILEPSCGCGRFMDAIRGRGAVAHGFEYDIDRVRQCRAKGHKVVQGNFLEAVPTPCYDKVIMNPPFYGKHYAKHVEHALKFLKDGGTLTAILPITARYDHGILDGRWSDLPVGAFRESGTNINTTILTIFK